MRQTLFYIPTEVFGVPLVGNGLLFWGILLFGIGWLFWTILKGKFNSDAVGFLAILLVGAFLSYVFLPKIMEPEGFPIRGYGVMLLLAILSSFALLAWRAKKKWNIPSDLVLSMVLWCVISGLIGARLFHVIEYWPNYMEETWTKSIVAMLMYAKGGLVVYGSIFGGMIGGAIFFFRHKLPVLATFDLIAPALFLGIALGRLGCFLNGCCYGGICESQCGVVFPPGSPAHEHQIQEGLVYLGGLKFEMHEHELPSQKGLGCGCFPQKAKPDLTVKDQQKKDRPLVIEAVEPKSDAERAGLKPGMTIQRIIARDPVSGQMNYYYGLDGFITGEQFLERFFLAVKSQPDAPFTVLVTEPGNQVEKSVAFVPGSPNVLPVAPAQLYSFVGGMLLCLLLLYLDRFCKRDGVMTLIFFLIYPIARFSIEMVRVDESSFLGTGLSISQNISLLTFVAALFLAYYIFSRPPRHAYAGMFPETAHKTTHETVPKTVRRNRQKTTKESP